MANKYSYLAKNTVIFTISSFGSKLLAFLLVPFYTNVLSKAEYGTADIVTTTSNLLVFAVTLCIADAVMRFAIESVESRYGVFRYGLKVVLTGCSIFGILLFGFSLLDPVHWSGSLYLLLFLSVLTNALNQLVSNYLRAIDEITSVAVMGILTTAITIICNLVLLLRFKLGVEGYLLSFVAGIALASVYGFIIIWKRDRACFSQICDGSTGKLMIAYSFPLVFNGLAWWVNGSLDRYCILLFHGAALNGLYAVASKIPTVISVVNQIFSQAWGLSAIKEFDGEDRDGFFRNIYALYNGVLVVSCSLLILLNIPLAKILFAKDFFVAWQYSSVLVISAVFSALSGFLGSIFAAVKKSRIFAVSTIAAALINTVLNLLLIPRFGALGAGAATGIAFFAVWLIRLVCAKRYLKLSVSLTRDCVCYGLIVAQVAAEHLDGHLYWVQGCIFTLILALYWKEIWQMTKRIGKMIRAFQSRRTQRPDERNEDR